MSGDARPLTSIERLNDKFELLEQAVLDSPEALYEAVVAAARDLFPDASSSVLYVLRGGRDDPYQTENIVADPRHLSDAAQPIRPNTGLGAYLINEGLLAVEDVHLNQPRLETASGSNMLLNTFVRGQSVRAFIGVRLGDHGDVCGILYVNWAGPRRFDASEIDIMQFLADYTARLIENHRRQEQYRLNAAESRSFDDLIANLSRQHTQVDLDAEIGALLRQAVITHPGARLALRIPGGGWREYWIAEGAVVQRALNRPDASDADIKRAGFIKQIAQHFQKADDQRRDHDVWESRYSEWGDAPYLIAANVKSGSNCIGVLACAIDAPTMPRTPFRKHPKLLRQRNILYRHARRFAVLLRQFDLMETLLALRELSTTLSENYDPVDISRQIVRRLAATLRQVDAITLYVEDDLMHRLSCTAAAGLLDTAPLDHFPPYDDTAIIDLMNELEPAIGERRLVENKLCEAEHIVTAAAYPLRQYEAQVGRPHTRSVGIIFYNYRMAHHFDDEERDVLGLFAETTTIVVNRAMQQRRLERERRHLAIVKDLAVALRSLDPDEVIRTILATIQRELRGIAQNVALVEYYERRGELIIMPVSLEFYHVDQAVTPGQPYIVPTNHNRGLAGRAIVEARTLIEDDVQTAPPPDYIPAIRATRSQICIPFSEQAALVVESDLPGAFTREDHVELLLRISDYAPIALQKAHEYAQLQRVKEQKWREEIAMLATGLVHDLRDIVSVIPAALGEMRRMDAEFDTRYAGPLADIGEVLNKTWKVNDLLDDFLRNHTFKPDWVSLAEVIDGGVALAEDYRRNGIRVRVIPRYLTSTLFVDKLWIELLLRNLLRNAYDAIRRSRRSGQVTVSASATRTRDIYYIRIKDTGDGIPREQWETIYEPLHTSSTDGLALHGLGLYYSREVARLHGGDLYVDSSEVGAGTVMCLRLPPVSIYQ